MNDSQIMPVLFVATNTLSSFGLFIPNAFSIDFFDNDAEDIRKGELLAGGISLLIALMVCQSAKSNLPLAAWALSAGFMAGVYEKRAGIWSKEN